MDREANLTWRYDIPQSNTLVDGTWWTNPDKVAEVSVDQEIAASMNLEIGDELNFSAGGKTFAQLFQVFGRLNGKVFLQISFLSYPQQQAENSLIHILQALR